MDFAERHEAIEVGLVIGPQLVLLHLDPILHLLTSQRLQQHVLCLGLQPLHHRLVLRQPLPDGRAEHQAVRQNVSASEIGDPGTVEFDRPKDPPLFVRVDEIPHRQSASVEAIEGDLLLTRGHVWTPAADPWRSFRQDGDALARHLGVEILRQRLDQASLLLPELLSLHLCGEYLRVVIGSRTFGQQRVDLVSVVHAERAGVLPQLELEQLLADPRRDAQRLHVQPSVEGLQHAAVFSGLGIDGPFPGHLLKPPSPLQFSHDLARLLQGLHPDAGELEQPAPLALLKAGLQLLVGDVAFALQHPSLVLGHQLSSPRLVPGASKCRDSVQTSVARLQKHQLHVDYRLQVVADLFDSLQARLKQLRHIGSDPRHLPEGDLLPPNRSQDDAVSVALPHGRKQ